MTIWNNLKQFEIKRESDNDGKVKAPIFFDLMAAWRVSRPFSHSESEQFGISCLIMLTLLLLSSKNEKYCSHIFLFVSDAVAWEKIECTTIKYTHIWYYLYIYKPTWSFHNEASLKKTPKYSHIFFERIHKSQVGSLFVGEDI